MQAGICLHSPCRAVSWNVDQKIKILEIIFCHIFTKQPCTPMFSGTLNTMSAIILAKLQSFGAKIWFSISLALDTHLKISSLFFIAILLLYSVQFFSLELLNALHIFTKTFLSSFLPFIYPTLSSSSLLCPSMLSKSLPDLFSLLFRLFFIFSPILLASFHPALICPRQPLSFLSSLLFLQARAV